MSLSDREPPLRSHLETVKESPYTVPAMCLSEEIVMRVQGGLNCLSFSSPPGLTFRCGYPYRSLLGKRNGSHAIKQTHLIVVILH
jgi:hypothetical protein